MTYKIVNLHRLKNHTHLWSFSLSMGGFLINGFVYNPQNKALLPPTSASGRRVVVPIGGVHINRLRARIEAKIEEAKMIEVYDSSPDKS